LHLAQLFYYAHECPIIPELIPIKIANYYPQNYAGILGSSLVSEHREHLTNLMYVHRPVDPLGLFILLYLFAVDIQSCSVHLAL